MSRRSRRYRARIPRGVRWLRFRHRVRRIVTLDRRRRARGSREPDELLMQDVHADGQRMLDSAKLRADAIVAEAVAAVDAAREQAAEIVGDAERIAREYLEALDSLLGRETGVRSATSNGGASTSGGEHGRVDLRPVRTPASNGAADEDHLVIVVDDESPFGPEAVLPSDERRRFAG